MRRYKVLDCIPKSIQVVLSDQLQVGTFEFTISAPQYASLGSDLIKLAEVDFGYPLAQPNCHYSKAVF
jgi:hypothetical protein